jgi:hypothetical protein
MMVSSNTVIDTTTGYKLIVSHCQKDAKTGNQRQKDAKTGNPRRCDVTEYDFWSPADYPNASQPNGGGADYLDAGNCTAGCLFNVLADESERHELSASHASVKTELMAVLVAEQAKVIQTPQVPDDPACCVAAQQRGGFLGPFLPDH